MRKLNEEIKLCRHLLKAVSAPKIMKVKLYQHFPDKIRGRLIKELEFNNDELGELRISNYVNFREYPLSEIIVEFEFNLNVQGKEISSYIRLNNDSLRRNYGDIELDVYPFDDVSNFGDLIRKFNLKNFKENIERVIKKYPKEFGIVIKEAYIAVSQGEPSIDFSKRIWVYYSQPFFCRFNKRKCSEGGK